MDDTSKFGLEGDQGQQEGGSLHEDGDKNGSSTGAKGGASGSDGDGGTTGGKTGGNRKRTGKKGRKDQGSQSQSGDGTGFKTTLVQLSEHVGKSETYSKAGAGADELRGEARSNLEQSIGRAVVSSSEPTNLTIEGTAFKDVDAVLTKNLRRANLPYQYVTETGIMQQVDTVTELIAIPTLPTDSKHKPEQFRSHKFLSDASDKVVEDDEFDPVYCGQFLGRSVTIKNRAIDKIQLIDMTPSDMSNIAIDATVPYSLSTNATLRSRESIVAGNAMEEFESSKKEGIAKNMIEQAPTTAKSLQTMMDLIRDTTSQFEKAMICATSFMASINQRRFYYGTHMNNMFHSLIENVRPILDMRADAKKYRTTSDIVNLSYLQSIIENAQRAMDETHCLYVYPKTSIALKTLYQDLMRWTKPSSDHRAVNFRCVNAYTTVFPYSTVTTVNGDLIASGKSIGGESIKRRILSFEDGNVKSISMIHPFWDGINETLSAGTMPKEHPWAQADEGKVINLTYDPENPTFAFLVLRSVPAIIERMKASFEKLYTYIAEGGSLCSTFTKYPTKNLWSFLDKAGYSKEHWHDHGQGYTSEASRTLSLRSRFPETMVLVNEDTEDAKSFYEYYPGLMSPYSLKYDGEQFSYGCRFRFPGGRDSINANYLIRSLDPVVMVNNSAFKTGPASALCPSDSKDATSQVRVRTPWVYAGNVTLAQWMTARRVLGLIYSIPSGLVHFNPVTSGKSTITDEDLKAALAQTLDTLDFTKLDGHLSMGLQLSSYRLEYGIPIDDYKSLLVTVCNTTHSTSDLCECLTYAANSTKTKCEGYLERVFAGSTTKLTTVCGPKDTCKFPCSWADITASDGPYACFDRWGAYAQFMQMYSNPFIGLRETKTVGEDAPHYLIPHQVSTNKVYYWIDLDCTDENNANLDRIDSDKNKLESMMYGA